MSARSRRLRGSLGDSWGDADYSSDGGASIHTASDLSDAASEGDLEEKSEEYRRENQDKATPLPPRVTRARSKTPQDTPVQTPANRVASRNSQTPRSSPQSQRKSLQSTPGSGAQSLEPSFIMPSIYSSTEGFSNGSPLRNSELRSRGPRQACQTDSAHSSPRMSNRRVSIKMTTSQPEQGQKLNQENGPWGHLYALWEHLGWPCLRYIMDVFSYSMEYFMKPIFAVFLFIFLFSSALNLTSNYVATKFYTALTPLCFLPGSSYILPFCAVQQPDLEENPLDFENLSSIQSPLGDIIEASKDTFALPSTMKSSEMAIRDLRTLVKWSNLPSKSQLEVEFDSFIETAREASGDLAKYNSKIGSTIDRVISTNSWTMSVLQGISEQEQQTGAVSRMLTPLNPLRLFIAPSPTLHQRIFDQYLLHVSKNKELITSLIQSAEALLLILHHLEERLDIIADIAFQDDRHISKNRDELLSSLWARLGGNSATRKEFEKSLALLKQVTEYRKEAIRHVTTTLLKLQDISAGLESLRDAVSEPEVLGWRAEIPLTYYIATSEKSIERMNERLRSVRADALQVEKQAYMRTMRGEEHRGLPSAKGTPTVYAR